MFLFQGPKVQLRKSLGTAATIYFSVKHKNSIQITCYTQLKELVLNNSNCLNLTPNLKKFTLQKTMLSILLCYHQLLTIFSWGFSHTRSLSLYSSKVAKPLKQKRNSKPLDSKGKELVNIFCRPFAQNTPLWKRKQQQKDHFRLRTSQISTFPFDQQPQQEIVP